MCVAPSGVDCAGCGLGVGGSKALKCSTPRCARYIHLKCSGFTAFHLVRFELTRAFNMCGKCAAEEIGAQYSLSYEEILNEISPQSGKLSGDRSSAEVDASAPSAPVLNSSCCDESDASVLVEPKRARMPSGS